MNLDIKQITGTTYSKDIQGKWYGSVIRHLHNIKCHVYITPNGWDINAHYFNTKEEVTSAATKAGIENIPYEVIQQAHAQHVMLTQNMDDFYKHEHRLFEEEY